MPFSSVSSYAPESFCYRADLVQPQVPTFLPFDLSLCSCGSHSVIIFLLHRFPVDVLPPVSPLIHPTVQSESCFHSLGCHFSGSGSSFLAWLISWCWDSVSSVSGKPFVPGILCGLSVPLASPGSPSGSRPGLLLTVSGPATYLGLWLAP